MTNELNTLTPREIDTKLADLDRDYLALEHSWNSRLSTLRYIDGQRPVYVGRRQYTLSAQETVERIKERLAAGTISSHEVAKAEGSLASLASLNDDMVANRAECEPFNAEYDRRPWARFFAVQGGHLHSGAWCAGGSLRPTP